jgi:hypothetical protein
MYPPMWTIYRYPNEQPEVVMARKFDVPEDGPMPSDTVIFADTVERAREMMLLVAPGIRSLGRAENEHPSTIEHWV